jgi:hypothetical protein
MNVIFGSGIVGLLARIILGDSWTVIPFYRSRFFSFNPALDDNFIICDDQLDPFIKDLMKDMAPQRFIYTRAWSVGGELLREWDSGVFNDWAYKIFGSQIPPQTEPYMINRMSLFVYDIRINQLYEQLQSIYIDELREEVTKGEVTEIGDHYFIQNGVRRDFDNAVSTIPLDALLRLMKQETTLPSKTVHYLHIQTEDLDFEGINQVMVSDPIFSFFKSTNVSPGRYLIYCHEEIPNPGIYFMSFIKKFDILDGTSIDGAIPMGPIPKIDAVEQRGIFSVGSSAQWDWCMDVGSCMIRILKYSQRGAKPGGKSKEVKLG